MRRYEIGGVTTAELVAFLASDDLAVRAAAAFCLGKSADRDALAALLSAWDKLDPAASDPSTRHLSRQILLAVYNIDDPSIVALMARFPWNDAELSEELGHMLRSGDRATGLNALAVLEGLPDRDVSETTAAIEKQILIALENGST